MSTADAGAFPPRHAGPGTVPHVWRVRVCGRALGQPPRAGAATATSPPGPRADVLSPSPVGRRGGHPGAGEGRGKQLPLGQCGTHKGCTWASQTPGGLGGQGGSGEVRVRRALFREPGFDKCKSSNYKPTHGLPTHQQSDT